MRQSHTRITIQQLRYLLKTIETGSVTVAAKELGISQSTLSEALSQLDAAVGFTVVERGRKGAHVTEEGAAFVAAAREAVQKMDELEDRFVLGRTPRQAFSVASQSFAFAWEALVTLSEKPEWSDFRFSWDLELPQIIVDRVVSGEANMGLICLMPGSDKPVKKLLKDSDVDFHEIMQARIFAEVSPEHPLAQDPARKSVTYDELSMYPYFAFEQFVHAEIANPDSASHAAAGTLLQGPYAAAKQSIDIVSYNIKTPNGLFVSPTQLVKRIANLNGYTIWSRVLTSGAIHTKIGDLSNVSSARKKELASHLANDVFPVEDVRTIPIETNERMVIGYVVRKGTALPDVGRALIEEVVRYEGQDEALMNN